MSAQAAEARPADPLPDLALARMARVTGDAEAERAALAAAERKSPGSPAVADELFLSTLVDACAAAAQQALQAEVEEWASFVLEQEPGHVRPRPERPPAAPAALREAVTGVPALAAALKAFAAGDLKEAASRSAAAEREMLPPDPATALRLLAGDAIVGNLANDRLAAIRTFVEARASFQGGVLLAPEDVLKQREKLTSLPAEIRALLSAAAAARVLSLDAPGDTEALWRVGNVALRALAISSLAASPCTPPDKGVPLAEKALGDLRSSKELLAKDPRCLMAEGVLLLRLAEIEPAGPKRRERAKACLSWAEAASSSLKTLHKFVELRAMSRLLVREFMWTDAPKSVIDEMRAARVAAAKETSEELLKSPGCTACLTIRSSSRRWTDPDRVFDDVLEARKGGAVALDHLLESARGPGVYRGRTPSTEDEARSRRSAAETLLRIRPETWTSHYTRMQALVFGTLFCRAFPIEEATKLALENLSAGTAAAGEESVEVFLLLVRLIPLPPPESPRDRAEAHQVPLARIDEMLASHPENYGLILMRGRFQREGAALLKEVADDAPHLSAAIRDLTRAAELSPRALRPWEELGALRHMQAQAISGGALRVPKLEQAAAAYDEAVKRAPSLAPLRDTLGDVRNELYTIKHRLGKEDSKLMQAAIDDWNAAASLDPLLRSIVEAKIKGIQAESRKK
ncbi:MAG: hypothetical protein AAB074_03260 [Planctomycetota bacterium]